MYLSSLDPLHWNPGHFLVNAAAGIRQDNRVAERGDRHKRGYRFFEDDEDEYRLEDLLQALCFLERGETWVPAKPWETGSTSAHIRELNLLPTDVQKLVHSFMNSSKES